MVRFSFARHDVLFDIFVRLHAQVLLTTEQGTYAVVRPASSYKKLYALQEQSELAFQVYAALAPAVGGNASATVDEVSQQHYWCMD